MVRDNNIRIRIFKNRLLYVLVCVLSGLTAIPLLAILGEVLIKGWKQLGWSFITEATPNAYKAMQAVSAGQDIPGGIANGIVGTFLMLMLAAVVAIPVGVFGKTGLQRLSVTLQTCFRVLLLSLSVLLHISGW